MATTTQTPARMHVLDVLRFAAAMAVVLYHFTATPTASRYWGQDVTLLFDGINHVTRYGWLAVEAFFIISGFAILWSSQGRSIAQYTGSRAGRLYPAFWACIGVTAVLQAFWSGGRQLSWGETVANLTMAPDLFGAELSQVVYWTLLVELKFYLLVGLLMAFGPLTRTRVLALAIAWPVAAQTVRGFGYPELAEHLVVRHAVYFSLGMLLFVLWQDVTARRSGDDGGTHAASSGPRPMVVAAALAGLLAWGAYQVVQAAGRAADLQGVPVHAGVAVVVLLAVVVTVWLATRPWAVVRRPWLAALCVLGGALTYPIYLVHTQFGWAATEVLTDLGVGAGATLAAATAVSLLLAVAIHYAAERPFSTRLRRAVTRWLTRTGTAKRPPRQTGTGAPSDPQRVGRRAEKLSSPASG